MKDYKWLDSPIFICGHPKSGTTLLTALLDNHPEIIVIPEETKFYHRFLRFNKITSYRKKDFAQSFEKFKSDLEKYSDLYKFKEDKINDSIGGNYDYSNVNYTSFIGKIKDHLNKHDFSTKSILQSFPLALLSSCDKFPDETQLKFWAEKTPYNEYYQKEILKDFPNAKFIHIIRDPRDNWVSYKKKNTKLRLKGFCRNWESSTKIAIKNKENPNYLTIRYEDLVGNIEEYSKLISKFLTIRLTESLSTPSKLGEPWHGNSMWDNRDTNINNKAIERYKTWQPESEIVEIESCLEKYITLLNYKRSYEISKPMQVDYKFFKLSIGIKRYIKKHFTRI